MNGIEKLTSRIAQDAEAEIQAITAQAEQEAAARLSAAQTQASQETELTLVKGRQEARERQQRLESMARMQTKQAILAAKQQVIAQAYDRAMETLCALPEEEMVPLLARLAAGAAETGREQLLLAPDQRAKYGQQVVSQANALLPQGQLTLGPADPSIRGGLILRSDAMDINCTFAALISQQRAGTTGTVAQLLFPQG